MAEPTSSDPEPDEAASDDAERPEEDEAGEEGTDEPRDEEEESAETPADEPEVAEEETGEEADGDNVEETAEPAGEADEMEDLEASLREGGADVEEAEEEEDEGPVKPVLKHEGRFYGTGRRKESVARVWIEAGDGTVTVNGRDGEAYFQNRSLWLQEINQPLECVDFDGDVDVWTTLEGGGLTGQAGALQLGLARALVEMDENARPWLKEEGLLTRDDRMVERKKINQPGARAKQQVSKR